MHKNLFYICGKIVRAFRYLSSTVRTKKTVSAIWCSVCDGSKQSKTKFNQKQKKRETHIECGCRKAPHTGLQHSKLTTRLKLSCSRLNAVNFAMLKSSVWLCLKHVSEKAQLQQYYASQPIATRYAAINRHFRIFEQENCCLCL